MLSQNCPVCHSSRIRRGYQPTPLWAKIFFRYNLLCDNCNWQFRGFALPGFISTKQTKSSRQRKEKSQFMKDNDLQQKETKVQKEPENVSFENTPPRAKKKIKVRI